MELNLNILYMDFNITHNVLNIPNDAILNLESTAEYWVEKAKKNSDSFEKLNSLNKAIILLEKFHSYFHFEQSYAYMLAALLYKEIGEIEKAIYYFERSLFQDHINFESMKYLTKIRTDKKYTETLKNISEDFSYNSHIKYEKEFLKFALGDFKITENIANVDKFIELSYNDNATIDDLKNFHYDSHRFLIAKFRYYFNQKSYAEATSHILAALEILETNHQNYHNQAALGYLMRASCYKEIGNDILYKNDQIKAYNLDSNLKLE